ncbi:restriction endonuclease subunit S [Streptomyces sp. LUP47B]|uniref:restriction endonuclease subunit S n=1 Tax=Streptomyces sp. LUP47B TaxID=1890286 RepID=UPI00099F5000|nr:restriction endonuclease subunit S [Streptomyces sp. LUP47B]
MKTPLANWSNSRIKHLAQVDYGLGQPPRLSESGVPILRATNINRGSISEAGLIYASLRDLPLDRAPLLKSGEILVVRSGAYTGDSALITDEWAGSAPGYDLRITPERVEPRYLAYCLLSSVAMQQMDIAKNRAAQPHLNAEELGEVTVDLPEQSEQRRIAEFLDAETARMDRLRSTLARFDGDVHEREQAVLAQMLHPGTEKPGDSLPNSWKWTPLAHLTDQFRQIMYGIVLPGPNVTEGVPIIKGGDVAADRLSLRTLNRTTREIESGYARSRVKGGDIVIAIRGSVGEIAVVPDELTGANLTQDAARISVASEVSADWLRLVLESPAVVHQIKQRVTGATIKGINIWDLKRVLVPTPSLAEQASLAASVSRSLGTHEALRSRVARHSALLTERRQALITAAVTGEIDVSTASGRGIEE